MASRISGEIKKTFALASLRKEAAKILSAPEWKKLQKIKQKYDEQKQFEKRNLDLEYQTRVEVARKRLINQAGQTQKRFEPVWARNDRFDRDAINRQAHRQVKARFKQIIQKFESLEARDIQGLMDRCAHKKRQREKPKNDFAKAVDRRRGPQRRQNKARRLTR